MNSIFKLFFVLLSFSSFAQSLTAMDVFDKVAINFGTCSDYEVDVTIKNPDKSVLAGHISFKAPDKIRFNFSQPAGQVIVSDGKILKVYVPATGVLLQQKLEKNGKQIPAYQSSEGFDFMRNNYKISYDVSPELQKYNNMSVPTSKLKLVRRNKGAGFKEIYIYADSRFNLIRIETFDSTQRGTTYDFSGFKFNVGVPSNRFTDYEVKGSAFTQNNFLFDPEG